MRYVLFFLFLLVAGTACGSPTRAQETNPTSEEIAEITVVYAPNLSKKSATSSSIRPLLFDGFVPGAKKPINSSVTTANKESTGTETNQPQTTFSTIQSTTTEAITATTQPQPKPSTTKPKPTVKPVHIELELISCLNVPVNLPREEFLEKLYWHCLSRSRQLGQVTDKDWQDWMSKIAADDTPAFRKKTRDTTFYKSPEALCLDFDDRQNCGNSALPSIKVPTHVTYGCKKYGNTLLYIGKRRVERILHVCGQSYPVKHGKN